MVNISQIMHGVGQVATSKGTTTMASKLLPKEIGVLFRELKTGGSDLVEITHRVNTKGKSPYCVCDIQVKDKSGNILDRLFASIADWNKSSSYTVKWRNGQTAVPKTEIKTISKDLQKGKDKVTKVTPEKPSNNKPVEQEIPFDKGNHKPIPGVPRPENKIIKFTPEKPSNNKPVEQEIPFDKGNHKPIPGVPRPEDKIIRFTPEKPSNNKPVETKPPQKDKSTGLVPHETQYIPNIRDFEINGLLDNNMSRRLETITRLQKDGRQALFNPMTGEPNVFWTFNREEAVDYFLKLLGRK